MLIQLLAVTVNKRRYYIINDAPWAQLGFQVRITHHRQNEALRVFTYQFFIRHSIECTQYTGFEVLFVCVYYK